ncbi:hypothetical protein [Planctobacterium marinum]|uniref:hypothetical protein n=1 Tax=Planctobacterium marinum TaxID=1631968 RepID=UPI001E2E1E22|nr:hypothetical protein [Planctobacterium marinum]MCC2608055.1 hypothetical protein [Planctobacterium marinum]
MLQEAEKYFQALDRVAKRDSTQQDIDDLIGMMHDSVKYEHIEYGANFDKKTWAEAFTRQLKNGAYQNGPENEIRILNVIYGKSHAAIEYSHGLLMDDGTWQPDKKMFALFGFTENKISLIREYW